MLFKPQLRERIRRGRIRCTVRIWTRPHVKVGGCYAMDEGWVVVESIEPIRLRDITSSLARESGFDSVADLLAVARHGGGRRVFLVRFHYRAPGGWSRPERAGDQPGGVTAGRSPSRSSSTRSGR